MDDFGKDVYCLLGLPFNAVDLAGAVRRVRQAATSRTPCFLSTPNLNFLITSLRDAPFRDSVLHSDLSVADGMPLVWIARLLDIPITGRVAGSSLFEALRKDTGPRLSVFFFGGEEGVAEAACSRLNAERSGLACAGFVAPGHGSVEDMSGEETLACINASGADFLVVSLGARKGQAWIERNLARLSVPVVSHLGAVVNFVAGQVRRAPVWMQRTGLEWLWRIKEEPTLWRRYASDGWALLGLLLTRVLPYAWHRRRHPPAAAELDRAGMVERQDGDTRTLRLRGAWHAGNLNSLRAAFAEAAAAGREVRLDLSQVSFVDSAFIGLVLLLRGSLSRNGKELRVESVQAPVRRIFEYCCADFLL